MPGRLAFGNGEDGDRRGHGRPAAPASHCSTSASLAVWPVPASRSSSRAFLASVSARARSPPVATSALARLNCATTSPACSPSCAAKMVAARSSSGRALWACCSELLLGRPVLRPTAGFVGRWGLLFGHGTFLGLGCPPRHFECCG